MAFPYPLSVLTALLLFCSHLFQYEASQTQTLPLQERNVLLKLKQHWGNPQSLGHWSTSSTSNNASSSFCGWPEIICYEGSVTGILLVGANISGTIPSFIHDLRDLSVLKISNNQFTGTLSDIFHAKLSWLEISNNKFSGKIPIRISSAGNLSVFLASNNLLSGEIPKELASLRHLVTLSLDGNHLSGHLPWDILLWKSLRKLNLSTNALSGPIPPGIGSLPRLIELDISENHFSGEIPATLANERFVFLNLSSNNLSGLVPIELKTTLSNKSFLNNPKLCSGDPSLHLNSCSAPAASGSIKSSLFSSKIIIAAVVGAMATTILLALIFTIFLSMRAHSLRQKEQRDLPRNKLVSFQNLELSESEILSSLTKENEIGSGGSGKVYKVKLNHPLQFVAIKNIWSSTRLEQKVEKEFSWEVEILSKIRHPNIVKLLGCVDSHHSKLLVYEYFENGSLYGWLHCRSRTGDGGSLVVLDWPTRLQIAVGAAKGLCYMHRCTPPIIHRDVKSSNILLDSEFNAIVADFGLARMLIKQNEPKTMSGFAGSFGYIAPEYAQNARVNEKTDVYSYGVVLLELVTGRKALLNGQTGPHRSLVEWAGYYRTDQRGMSVLRALDEDINEARYVPEMIRVFELGLRCTGAVAATRPSMEEVLHALSQCSRPPAQAHQQKNVRARCHGSTSPYLARDAFSV